MFFMTSLTVFVVATLYWLRDHLEPLYGAENAQTIVSLANSLQIGAGNAVYTILAKKLTVRENHRTDQEYGDYLILKVSLFKFINSFASFFYIAFIAAYIPAKFDDDGDDPSRSYPGRCGHPSCMIPLQSNLFIIFVSQIAGNSVAQIVGPYVNYLLRSQVYGVKILPSIYGKMREKDKFRILSVEQQQAKPVYDPIDDGVEDFAEIVIQFGFLTLFIPALPPAGLFAMIFNTFQIKTDSLKLLKYYQRPFPLQDNDIGTWKVIFSIISGLAMVTNGGLIFFTMQLKELENVELEHKIWFFLFFIIGVQFLRKLIEVTISGNEKEEITIQGKRTNYIVSKLIDKLHDDNDKDDFEAEILRQTHKMEETSLLA